MNRRAAGCVCALITMGVASGVVPANALDRGTLGHWEGVLRFRGDDMPLRLHIEKSADTLVATLDLPALVMAWEPVRARAKGVGVAVTLPFGLDALALRRRGDAMRGEKMLGKDTLVCVLARTAPPPFTSEEVAFMSDGARLAGTLVRPAGAGPFPGLVLVHGSGAASRGSWSYRSWADHFARRGIATLCYDKRGKGASQGEGAEADLTQLAADVNAAVAWLAARPEIDARNIGLKGSSQGGWVAPMAAARDSGSVAWMILTSAAAGTPREQEFQSLEARMRADGQPDSVIQSGLAYTGLYFYVVHSGLGWETLRAAIDRAYQEPWGDYVDKPRGMEDLAWWRSNHAVDARAALADFAGPVLALYGGADVIVPPLQNAGRLRDLMGPRAKATVHVGPGADHRLELPLGRDTAGVWHWARIAPDVISVTNAWLQVNVTAR